MRQFLVMEEISPDKINPVETVLIRVKVNSKADAVANKTEYTAVFAGIPHKATYRISRHDEDGSCTEEEI